MELLDYFPILHVHSSVFSFHYKSVHCVRAFMNFFHIFFPFSAFLFKSFDRIEVKISLFDNIWIFGELFWQIIFFSIKKFILNIISSKFIEKWRIFFWKNIFLNILRQKEAKNAKILDKIRSYYERPKIISLNFKKAKKLISFRLRRALSGPPAHIFRPYF